MRFSCPSARLATLVLVVYLALFAPVAGSATGEGEAENARAEAYRANLLTPCEERAVGERLAFLYEQRHPSLKDQAVQARLKRITARLRSAIPVQALDIKVIEGARPEAVSFPAGHIFITEGLIRLAANDDDLAAVVAHEAAHVANHHLARLIALALMLPSNERERFPARAAIIKGQAAQFTFPAALEPERLRYEMEADEIAVGWLESAGYKGQALATLLDNLRSRLSPYAQPERAAISARVRQLNQQSLLSAR